MMLPGEGRTATRSAPLEGREALLVTLTAVHLSFLPWALGAVHAWSQWVSLALSTAGFLIAVPGKNTPAAHRPAAPSTPLWKWPFFWLGLLLAAYVAVQGLNPSWRYVSDGQTWSLVPVAHVMWLPTGVDAPFARSNPFRSLLVLVSLWLLVCSVHTGFTRRQSFRILFAVLSINGALLTLLGVAEKMTVATKIYWRYAPSSEEVTSSFIYRNHAGAYFNLVVAVTVGLAGWHYRRYLRRLEGPARTILFSFLSGFVSLMVIFSQSRAATGVLFLFALASAVGYLLHFLSQQAGRRSRQGMIVLGSALACCTIVGLISLRSDVVRSRFEQLAHSPSATSQERAIAQRAGADMLRGNWIFGWGAGCFRYGFPIYQQRYPDIYQWSNGTHKYWEHVHDDLLETPIELGVVGSLPLVIATAWAIAALWRRRAWKNFLSYGLLTACGLALLHACVDFIFQCPAVLLTWAVLLVGASRWSQLDPTIPRQDPSLQKANIRAPASASPV